ncbi:hypothetical protein [Bartonella quintana]|nr:hypothetical protein [Bartonella quintana]
MMNVQIGKDLELVMSLGGSVMHFIFTNEKIHFIMYFLIGYDVLSRDKI